MSTLITPDDLEEGLHVAVHSHGVSEPYIQFTQSDTVVHVMREESARPALGVPMRIVAVDLPFIYCMVIEPGGSEDGPIIIDVRTLSLMRLNVETVRAIAKIRVRS